MSMSMPWRMPYVKCDCHKYVPSGRVPAFYTLDKQVEEYFWWQMRHYRDGITPERCGEVASLVRVDVSVVFGKPHMAGTRLWIELIILQIIHNDLKEAWTDELVPYQDCYDAAVVWFFDVWMPNVIPLPSDTRETRRAFYDDDEQ